MTETPVEAPTRNLKNRAVRGSIVVLGAQGLHIVLHMISVMTLARLLTPADFGLVAMVAPVQALAVLIKTIGLGDAVVQRQDLKPSQLNSLFWIQFGVCAALAVMMTLMAPAVAWFYGREALVAVTIVYSSVILFGGLSSVHQNLLTRKMAFGQVAFVQVASAVSGFITGIIAALMLKSYWALVLMVVTKAAMEMVLFWGFARWIPGRPRLVEGVGDLVRFGSSVAGAKIAHYVANNGTTILLGKVLGDVALGLYDRANRLLVYPTQQLHRPLQGVGVPLLSRLQNDEKRYRTAFLTLLQGLAITASPALVTVVIYAEEVALLAFGEGWSDVVPIFALLAPVTLSQLLNHPLSWLYFTQGRAGEMVAWAWTRSMILFAAVICALPFGLVAVVGAFAAAQILIVTPLLWFWSTRTGPVRFKDAFAAMLPYLSGMAPTLGVLHVMRPRLDFVSWIELPIAVATAYAIMGLVAMAFPRGRQGLSELLRLRHQLMKRPAAAARSASTQSVDPVIAKGA